MQAKMMQQQHIKIYTSFLNPLSAATDATNAAEISDHVMNVL